MHYRAKKPIKNFCNEGGLAATYAFFKETDAIKGIISKEGVSSYAIASIAEIKDAQNDRDKSYNVLRDIETKEVTENEFNEFCKELVKGFDMSFDIILKEVDVDEMFERVNKKILRERLQ